MAKIPSFSGEGEEKARRIVDWVEETLQHERLTAAKLSRFGRFSPSEILSKGKVLSALGCLDKAAIIGSLLQKNGFETFIITERVYRKGKPAGLHFCIEARDSRVELTIDPKSTNTDIIPGWAGGSRLFTPKGGLPQRFERVFRRKIPKNSMSMHSFSLAGVNGWAHYFWLSGMPAASFAKSTLSKTTRKHNEKIVAARNMARRPK